MNWSDFWNKPIEISYGGLMVFLFAVSGWYAHGRSIMRNAGRRFKRYNEKYPFGEPRDET